jgi:hypothetical protein
VAQPGHGGHGPVEAPVAPGVELADGGRHLGREPVEQAQRLQQAVAVGGDLGVLHGGGESFDHRVIVHMFDPRVKERHRNHRKIILGDDRFVR